MNNIAIIKPDRNFKFRSKMVISKNLIQMIKISFDFLVIFDREFLFIFELNAPFRIKNGPFLRKYRDKNNLFAIFRQKFRKSKIWLKIATKNHVFLTRNRSFSSKIFFIIFELTHFFSMKTVYFAIKIIKKNREKMTYIHGHLRSKFF